MQCSNITECEIQNAESHWHKNKSKKLGKRIFFIMMKACTVYNELKQPTEIGYPISKKKKKMDK